jgi:hypothetical protein
MKTTKLLKVFCLVVLVTGLLIPFNSAHASTGAALPSFTDFVSSVKNGQADAIRGVYVTGLFAYRVVTQPANNPGYISKTDGTVTQFGMAASLNVIGLLAHNNLAGASFFSLTVGQEINIIYGDGRVVTYIVNQISRFQALQPSSENSSFVDLNTKNVYFAGSLFNKFYQGSDHVTFQTCIAQDDIASWGRLFITANPATTKTTTANPQSQTRLARVLTQ